MADPLTLPLTTGLAGVLGLFYVLLSARVILRRRGAGVSLGDGGDTTLLRRIRGHGNFAEYVPLGLGLLALAELQQTPMWALALLGAAFGLGRLVHGAIFSFGIHSPAGRVFGTAPTLSSLSLLALSNLVMLGLA